MFHPFQQLNDLKCDGSYWKMFHNELEKHINKEDTVFWKKGFEILQNIQDRPTLEKHVKRARDPISITTKNETPNKTNSKQTLSPIGSSNVIDILDMNKQFKYVTWNINVSKTKKSKMEYLVIPKLNIT